MTATSPYRAAGLKRNPFVIENSLVIPDELWLDRNYPPTPTPAQRSLIQVMGPPGTGKTSLLSHWRERVPGPYLHYPPGLGRFRFPPVAPIAYWDEADRIPTLMLNVALRSAARKSATLICGTHKDLSRSAIRFGFSVDTIEPPPISPEELIAWTELKIRLARIDPHQPSRMSLAREEADQIVRESGHSWRTAADLLHIWMARKVAERPPSADRQGCNLNQSEVEREAK